MNATEVRELLERQPFQPFRLIMSSGRTYDITNPGLAVVLKSDVFVALDDGDRWVLAPLLHVFGIEAIRHGGRRKRA